MCYHDDDDDDDDDGGGGGEGLVKLIECQLCGM